MLLRTAFSSVTHRDVLAGSRANHSVLHLGDPPILEIPAESTGLDPGQIGGTSLSEDN